jgi:uncharacterized protein YqjF (DUF2071 family)
MAMRWHDLLFMHWPVPVETLRPLVPPALEIETFDATAWIGVVPFRMTGVRPRFTPAFPGLSRFPELNVRTYVTHGGRPGVWFFSLDAANRLAVWTARGTFHLPYFFARMSAVERGDWICYRSERIQGGAPSAKFAGRYRPAGEVFHAASGRIDHWLTERYCLYAVDHANRLYRGEIHHRPWPLHHAEAEVECNTMTEPLGVRLHGAKPLLHFARRLDVVAWRLRPTEE